MSADNGRVLTPARSIVVEIALRLNGGSIDQLSHNGVCYIGTRFPATYSKPHLAIANLDRI
jgi:hypothetical protein